MLFDVRYGMPLWFDVKYCWAVVGTDVECIHLVASRTSLHHYHHILHCIIPHQTPSLTLFQTTPHSTSDHFSTFHIAVTSTSCSALFHFTIPYFKSHHLGHMHHTRHLHCTPESQYWCTTQRHIPCTPRHITSFHTIYWPHHLCIALATFRITTFYTTLHRIWL